MDINHRSINQITVIALKEVSLQNVINVKLRLNPVKLQRRNLKKTHLITNQ